jgi:hypothetical protein
MLLFVVRNTTMKLTVRSTSGKELQFEGNVIELTELARNLENPSGLSELAVVQNGASSDGAAKQTRTWNHESIGRLWKLLWGDQKKLVKFLASKKTGTAFYSEIGKFMGYNGQHLSGILSPITRNSQSATRDRLARLVDWRPTERGQREYFIHPEAFPFLKEIVDSET